MAASTLPLISVEEYLSTAYHPDCEFVNGQIVERCVGTTGHSLLQVLLVAHFSQLRKQFRYAVLTEARTVVTPRAKYRIPDVLLAALPVPKGRVIDTVPLAVFEVLSPDDRMPDQLRRYRDYQQLGVAHIIVLDPEEYLAYRFQKGVLQEVVIQSLNLSKGEVPFDTHVLFQQLREEFDASE